jgi:hypothetical protein
MAYCITVVPGVSGHTMVQGALVMEDASPLRKPRKLSATRLSSGY